MDNAKNYLGMGDFAIENGRCGKIIQVFAAKCNIQLRSEEMEQVVKGDAKKQLGMDDTETQLGMDDLSTKNERLWNF